MEGGLEGGEYRGCTTAGDGGGGGGEGGGSGGRVPERRSSLKAQLDPTDDSDATKSGALLKTHRASARLPRPRAPLGRKDARLKEALITEVLGLFRLMDATLFSPDQLTAAVNRHEKRLKDPLACAFLCYVCVCVYVRACKPSYVCVCVRARDRRTQVTTWRLLIIT